MQIDRKEQNQEPIPAPRVVIFEDWDDGDIYDHTQTNVHIRAGDILVMLNKKEGSSKQERRVGLMYSAWPVILVGESDCLHSPKGFEGQDPVAAARDWLAMATKEDPRNKAAAPLLKALIMNPGAGLDELLREGMVLHLLQTDDFDPGIHWRDFTDVKTLQGAARAPTGPANHPRPPTP